MRAGPLTSVALTEACLDRIATRDPHLHAFVALNDAALTQAAAADQAFATGQDLGPLHGIPLGIKDLIDVAGLPATCGSAVFASRIPAEDAATVARLRAGGAVLLGKLATYEFAMVGPDLTLPSPPARNPWNNAHITGGSSSGSAAAVAGGLIRAALGTDTGGSIRSPAAYCGCVGLKPSFGRASTRGVFPLSPSLDHVGPLAATVHEAALLLDAISDPAWRPATALIGQDIHGLRLAYARDWFAHDPQADPALIRAMDDAASQLSLLGARIEEVQLPDYALYEAAGSVILHAEALKVHQTLMATQSAAYGRPTLQCLAFGAAIDQTALANSRRAATLLTRQMQTALAPYAAMILPTTLTTALPFAAFDGEQAVWTPMRTIPFDVTGQPAISVPIGFANNLPLGMQIVGPMGADDMICRIGHAYEGATDANLLKPY
ncbi:MAG: amidase [Candidatus Saccharibacteria bacterium]|nr:amidase [Pseudorhodobacter sp.]